MSRANVRDKWARAVLASDLTPATKNVMTALSYKMDDLGRVRCPRADLAAATGTRSHARISDRIKEAKDAGFLTHTGGGKNAQVAQYYAAFPAAATPNRGTRNGVPGMGSPAGPATPNRGTIRARASLETTHGTPPAPDGSRVSGLHLVQTQDGSNEGVSPYSPPAASQVLDAPTTTSDKPTARAGRTRVLPATRPTTARVTEHVAEHRPGNDVPPVHDYPSPPGRGATRDDYEAYGRALRLLVLDNTKVDAA